MEIDHVTCTAEGAPVEHSTDIFLPRSLDLHVMRWLEDMPPVPAIGRADKDLRPSCKGQSVCRAVRQRGDGPTTLTLRSEPQSHRVGLKTYLPELSAPAPSAVNLSAHRVTPHTM